MQNVLRNTWLSGITLLYLCLGDVLFAASSPNILSGNFSETISATSFQRDGFYQLTPDGIRVLYTGLPGSGDSSSRQLYSVNLDGSQPTVLTDHTRDGGMGGFQVTQDSQRVVFRTGSGLYSVDISGSAIPIKLDNAPTLRANEFSISPDSQHVVFTTFGGIYSVPIAGGAIELLSDTNYPDEGDPSLIAISSDSLRVVFSRIEFFSDGSSTLHILSTPIIGGALSELLPTDTLQDTFAFEIDPAGQNFIYLSSGTDLQLFAVPIEGGTRVPLSPAYDFGFNIIFEPSSDGNHVLYTVQSLDGSMDDRTYLIPIGGGVPIQLDSGLSAGSKGCGLGFSPDASKLIFCRGSSRSGPGVLFAASVDTPNILTPLNSGAVVHGFSSDSQFAEEGTILLMPHTIANGDSFDHSLIKLPLSGAIAELVFSFESAFSVDACFSEIDFSQDGSVFTNCQLENGDSRALLFAQNTQNGNTLNIDGGDENPNQIIEFHAVTKDGKFVVYLKFIQGEGKYQLLSLPLVFDSEFCFPIISGNSAAMICL